MNGLRQPRARVRARRVHGDSVPQGLHPARQPDRRQPGRARRPARRRRRAPYPGLRPGRQQLPADVRIHRASRAARGSRPTWAHRGCLRARPRKPAVWLPAWPASAPRRWAHFQRTEHRPRSEGVAALERACGRHLLDVTATQPPPAPNLGRRQQLRVHQLQHPARGEPEHQGRGLHVEPHVAIGRPPATFSPRPS